MSYTKQTWEDRQVQNPMTFTMVTNSDGTVTLTPAPGTVTSAGTLMTAERLNHMEAGIEDASKSGGDSFPVGTMTLLTTDTIPDNWLLCDGSAVSRTTYSDLFTAIGTTYGAGDGSTTFNVPNLKGRVPVGKNSNDTDFDTLGEIGGEKTHTLTINEIPSHTHTVTANSIGGSNIAYVGGAGSSVPNPAGNITIGSTGGSQFHNNLQPYIVTNYIIKAIESMAVVATVQNSKSSSVADVYSCNYVNNVMSGTVLYNNSTGISTGSFALNDDISNYERIEMYDETGNIVGKYLPDTTRFYASFINRGLSNLYIFSARLTRANNVLTFETNHRDYFNGTSWNTDDEVLLKISKVIGYKY